MKKSILIGLLVFVGFAANAQMCDTVRLFPWNNNFYTHFDCWERLGDSTPLWHANSDNIYNFQNAAYIVAPNDTAANGCVLVSPALALPADTSNMLLSFRTRRVGATVRLRVLVSTGQRENLAGYDTLLNVTPSGINNYEVNLSAYAGQTVYVAFSFVKANQTNDVAFFGVGSVNIVSDHMPQGDWLMQNMAERTGDTVEHEFYLTQGIEEDTNTSFVWHSTMVDAGQAVLVDTQTDLYLDASAGVMLPRSIYRLVYLTTGVDTVTVTASNMYGTITSQSVSNVYDCAPVSEFPWTMDLGDLNVCWYSEFSISNNATHGYNDEDGEIYYTDCQLQSQSYTENYVVTNAIAVPADAAHLALTLRWRKGVIEVRAVRVGQETGLWDYVLDTTLFNDLLFNEEGSTLLKTRKVSLAAYSGDTIRLAVFHKSSNVMYLMPLSIDYDTLPKIASVQVPSLAMVDSAALCTASLRYGATEGLHYSWSSVRGGVFVTNALGDSAWVTYPGGYEGYDTITVVASNAYGIDTAVGILRILDCTTQMTLPWKETFANGTVCWYKSHGCKFYDAAPYPYSDSKRYLYLNARTDTLGSWIMSKAIAIPADTSLDVRLFWKVASSNATYHHLYSMLATTSDNYTDTANYAVILTDSSTHINYGNYDARSASLSRFAGQTIHIAIHNHAGHLAPSSIGLYLDDIEVRTTTVPVVTLASNANAYFWDDTAIFTASLFEGNPNGMTYKWHSTLLDSTIATNDGVWQFRYGMQSGTDTVSVIASNIYGSDTAALTVSIQAPPLPLVTLSALSEVVIPESATISYTINNCSTNGLVVSCHSSLLDTTFYDIHPLEGSAWELHYSTDGFDTVTVIVSNVYGADTAVVVFEVINCGARSLPYYEYFENISPTAWNEAGVVPTCWNATNNGYNTNYAPHVINSNGYSYLSNLSGNALFFIAGSSNYGNCSEASLPLFAASLQSLTMMLDYRYENVNYGTLTVGFYTVDSVFTPVAVLPPHSGSYLRDTISFAAASIEYARIVIRWEHGSLYFGAVVDNIEIVQSDITGIHAPLGLTLDTLRSQCVAISWFPYEGASGYHLYIDGVLDTVLTATALSFCNLTPSTSYTVQLAAIVGGDTGYYAVMPFVTPCHIYSFPWLEDFEGDEPLACWTKMFSDTYLQVQGESYLDQFFHSGGHAMMIDCSNSSSVIYVSTPFVELPANQMLVSFWACGVALEDSTTLTVGVLTNPIDSSTFVPLMNCSLTSVPTRYEFDTRGVGDGYAAVAFRTYGSHGGIMVDDIAIEPLTPCARIRMVESNPVNAHTSVLEWQMDTASEVAPTTIQICLFDLTDSVIASILTVAGTQTSDTISGLAVGHRYYASLQVICGSLLSDTIGTLVVPSANPCAEVRSNQSHGWTLINSDRPYSYSQTLYSIVLAASIDTLFGVAYRVGVSDDEPRLIDVYIGQTLDSVLSSPVSVANHTLAVENYSISLRDTGWVHVNFTNPVALDGVSNLIVTVDDNTGIVTGYSEFGGHSSDFGVSFITSTASYNVNQTYDPYNPGGFYTHEGIIPDIQLLGGCSTDRCLRPLPSVLAVDTHSVTVGWYRRGSESQWEVKYKIEGDDSWIVADTIADTMYTIAELNASTAYRIRVSSICTNQSIVSEELRALTLCDVVSIPYYQTFRADNLSHNETFAPCWQIGDIMVLSNNRGLWNTNHNGDFVISPELDADINSLRVRVVANGSTFFLAGLKVGACDANGENLVWIDTITLDGTLQEYSVYCRDYEGDERHLAIGGSYESWTLYDVTVDFAPYCFPVNRISYNQITENGLNLYWTPQNWPGQWAVYFQDSLVGVTADTTFGLYNLNSGENYTAAVREICGAGDTSVATMVDFATLCSPLSLPWSEDFEDMSVPQFTTPDCWPHSYRDVVGNIKDLAYLSGSSNKFLYLYNDTRGSNQRDTARSNFVCTPLINTRGNSIAVDFDACKSNGDVTVGVMTDVSDSDSFIPILSIAHSSVFTHCHFTTDSLILPPKYAVAFRFRTFTTCKIDNIVIESLTSDTVWYTVNVVRNLEGMIDEFPEGYVSGNGVYADGDTVTLSLPDYEYGYKCPPYFYGWVMAPGDTIFGLECTFVVTSDTTITAYYRYGVGIDSQQPMANSQLTIFPNPATETVTVYVDQPATLTIMDATGRLCGQWKVERGETTLDISHLPAGVYFVRLANNTIVRKLIKE